MSKLKMALAACAASLAIAPAAGAAELVTNGDFEAGNTGFTSDYTYMVANFYDPAVYGVDNDPQDGHGSFASFGDHTSGTGLMMVVNGSETPDSIFWGQASLSIIQNTDYTFSFWMASVYPENPAVIAPTVNGLALTPLANAPGATGVWTQHIYTWNSGDATSATFELVNNNLNYHGNDFALDDISFSGAVPEPTTWALMIMGFGGAGAMLRRRRVLAAA